MILAPLQFKVFPVYQCIWVSFLAQLLQSLVVEPVDLIGWVLPRQKLNNSVQATRQHPLPLNDSGGGIQCKRCCCQKLKSKLAQAQHVILVNDLPVVAEASFLHNIVTVVDAKLSYTRSS